MSDTDQARIKLDTKIEQEVHRLIQSISEGVYDRLNIYVRRNDIPIDMEVFNALLHTTRATITELEMAGLDQFHLNVKRELDTYVGESENPTGGVETTPSKNGRTTKVTLAL